MSTALSAEVLDDDVAMSLARGIAAANRAAKEIGVDLPDSLVTITQVSDEKPHWRINYGPKNYRNRRGGDVIVEVDAEDASIQKVLRGQ
ncbi:MAG: hypothetical protein K8R36_24245 [Planctomycetales bacterium]|nr:hypothetical protein [Planctomycetales bacterium]